MLRVHFFFTDESLQLSLSNKSFYLLFQVIVVDCVMTVVIVEVAILVSGPFIGISLQLAGKFQGSFVFDLHQDLVDRGSQRGEACEPLCGGLGMLVILSFSGPSHLPPPILSYVFLSFPLLGLLFSGQ